MESLAAYDAANHAHPSASCETGSAAAQQQTSKPLGICTGQRWLSSTAELVRHTCVEQPTSLKTLSAMLDRPLVDFFSHMP